MHKSFIKYILLFVVLIVIIDFGAGKILSGAFKKISFGTYGDINRSLRSESDLLILGSSRARHHYDSKLLMNDLKITCYNSGQGGQGLFLNYAILKERIKHKAPKFVILDLSPNVIVDKESYSKLNILLPYYKEHESFSEIVQIDPDFSKLKLASSLYIYNSTLYDFIRSYSPNEKDLNLGFEPLEGIIDESVFEPFNLEAEKVENNKFLYFYKIIKLCKGNNIKLIVVTSPTFTKFDKENRIIDAFKTILSNNDIAFYDYSDFSKLYLNPKYFTDQLHLNNTGAAIFSKDLAEKLNDIKVNP